MLVYACIYLGKADLAFLPCSLEGDVGTYTLFCSCCLRCVSGPVSSKECGGEPVF